MEIDTVTILTNTDDALLKADAVTSLTNTVDSLLKADDRDLTKLANRLLSTIKELQATLPKNVIQEALVDVFWLYDIRFEVGTHAYDKEGLSPQVSLLLFLARILLKNGHFDANVLKERFEPEMLETLFLIPSAAFLTKKTVRVNTSLLYKQQKFNLLWEENEGYSKLLVEILSTVTSFAECQQSEHAYLLTNVHSLIQRIQATVGYFDLDPNRVLDLMVDCFTGHIDHHQYFTQLFTSYVDEQRRPAFSQIIGFKFEMLHEKSATPRPFFLAVSHLIKAGLIQLKALIPHLSPSSDELLKICKAYLKEKITASRQGGHSLDIIGSFVVIEELSSSATTQDEKIDGPPATEQQQQQQPPPPVNYLECYQPLGLLEGLFHVNDYNNAMLLYAQLPNSTIFIFGCHPQMSRSFGGMLRTMISPLYSSVWMKTPIDASILQSTLPYYPSITSFDHLYSTVFPLLYPFGPYLHNDPVLFTQLCRLGRHIIRHGDHSAWASLIKNSLLPSLSLMTANASCALTFWQFFKHVPFQERYAFYAENRLAFDTSVTAGKYPELLALSRDLMTESRRLLRRLSKDTVTLMSRRLGKLSHGMPMIVFEVILDQVTSYDNLIPVVVDSLKYLTNLSFDVLSFCLINALRRDISRLKEDGGSLALWLNSLAQLTGSLYRKYPMDLDPMLIFIAKRLRDRETYDLILLQNLLESMGGMEKQEDLSEEQLYLSGLGGDILRHHITTLSTIHIVGAKPQTVHTKKSAKRLRDALQGTNLAAALAVCVAQQSTSSIYEKNLHVKLASRLYDTCQETLMMYLKFVEAKKGWPNFEELVLKHHIEPEIAFMMCRSVIREQINQMTIDTAQDNMTLHSLFEYIPRCLPELCESGVSTSLYATFWQLSPDELCVCDSLYQNEISKLTNVNGSHHQHQHNGDTSSSSSKSRKNATATLEDLSAEYEKRKNDIEKTLIRIKQEKGMWVPPSEHRVNFVAQFIQCCIFPRSVQSTLDALYCAKFVQILHQLNIENISTLGIYDRIASDITMVIYASTCNEIAHYGKFIYECLSVWQKWHNDEALYKKEALGLDVGELLVGFAKKWGTTITAESGLLSYEDFRHAVYKWHLKINRAIIKCLESKDYMPVKNALVFLTKITDFFPIVERMGLSIEERLKTLRETEDREDIKVLATRVSAMVQNKKANWIIEDFFHVTDKTEEMTKKRRLALEEAEEKEREAEMEAEKRRQETRSYRQPTSAYSSRYQPMPHQHHRDQHTRYNDTDRSYRPMDTRKFDGKVPVEMLGASSSSSRYGSGDFGKGDRYPEPISSKRPYEVGGMEQQREPYHAPRHFPPRSNPPPFIPNIRDDRLSDTKRLRREEMHQETERMPRSVNPRMPPFERDHRGGDFYNRKSRYNP